MKCMIEDKQYCFMPNAMADTEARKAYFELANEVFKLQFDRWYSTGYVDDSYIPYTLFDGGAAVASVGVSITNLKWKNVTKCYAQLSTVMTRQEYRGKGLSRWLIEKVLKEWKQKSDMIYLYANDSVVNFYPKFGFVEAAQYQNHKPVIRKDGKSRILDMSLHQNIDLLVEKFCLSNPFSAFTMEDNESLVVFHCTSFMKNHVYYIDQYDAVVVGEYVGDIFICYDIYTDADCSLGDILGVMAKEDTKFVSFGFTPKSNEGGTIAELQEENTTLFVLAGNENLIEENKLTLPFLSRA